MVKSFFTPPPATGRSDPKNFSGASRPKIFQGIQKGYHSKGLDEIRSNTMSFALFAQHFLIYDPILHFSKKNYFFHFLKKFLR